MWSKSLVTLVTLLAIDLVSATAGTAPEKDPKPFRLSGKRTLWSKLVTIKVKHVKNFPAYISCNRYTKDLKKTLGRAYGSYQLTAALDHPVEPFRGRKIPPPVPGSALFPTYAPCNSNLPLYNAYVTAENRELDYQFLWDETTGTATFCQSTYFESVLFDDGTYDACYGSWAPSWEKHPELARIAPTHPKFALGKVEHLPIKNFADFSNHTSCDRDNGEPLAYTGNEIKQALRRGAVYKGPDSSVSDSTITQNCNLKLPWYEAYLGKLNAPDARVTFAWDAKTGTAHSCLTFSMTPITVFNYLPIPCWEN